LLYIGKTIANAATAATLDVLHTEFPQSVHRAHGLQEGVTKTALKLAGRPLGSSYRGWKQQMDLNRRHKSSVRRTNKMDIAMEKKALIPRRPRNISSPSPHENTAKDGAFDKDDYSDNDVLSVAGSEDLEHEAAKRLTKKRHNIYGIPSSEYEDSDHESTDSLLYSPHTRSLTASPGFDHNTSGHVAHDNEHDGQSLSGRNGTGDDGQDISTSKFLNQVV